MAISSYLTERKRASFASLSTHFLRCSSLLKSNFSATKTSDIF
ncbi:MAG: hypothetical protein ACI4M6_01940 [Christensenellaceae bacterium]